MADINAVDLEAETYSTLDGTENFVMFDTAEGKKATMAAVCEYMLKQIAVMDNSTVNAIITSIKNRLTALEANNAFDEVVVGSTQVQADSAGDYLTLVAGNKMNITADATNDTITFAVDSLTKSDVGLGNCDNTADANKNVANAGTVNYHTVASDVPANAVFTDTTYSDATQSASGLMSATDKVQVDKIGNATMGTTATTLTGAIAEHESDIIALNSSDQIKIVEYISLGSLSVNTSGAADATVDISSSIPSGYKLAAVIPRGTGSYAFYFYLCARASNTSVRVTLFRSTGSATSITPNVAAICVKA